jgi:hypothetical protein
MRHQLSRRRRWVADQTAKLRPHAFRQHLVDAPGFESSPSWALSASPPARKRSRIVLPVATAIPMAPAGCGQCVKHASQAAASLDVAHLAPNIAGLRLYHIGRVGVRSFVIVVTDEQEQSLCHCFRSAILACRSHGVTMQEGTDAGTRVAMGGATAADSSQSYLIR